MIFDTHSHCYWDSLLPHIEQVINNMEKQWVVRATQIGCDPATSKQAISLARRFPEKFVATVGLHPQNAQDHFGYRNQWETTLALMSKKNISYKSKSKKQEISSLDMLDVFDKLIRENRDIIVWVGECGLDFHTLDGSQWWTQKISLDHLSSLAQEQIENQKHWWKAQWELAKKYDLPLIIHTRDARDETLAYIQEYSIHRCVLHCYTEDWEFAKTLLYFSDEIYFSFSGIVTYKNAQKVQETAKNLPLDRILIETDSPFLAPWPVRWQVNEPAHVRYVLEKIAEIRDERKEYIEEIIYENSLRFFRHA